MHGGWGGTGGPETDCPGEWGCGRGVSGSLRGTGGLEAVGWLGLPWAPLLRHLSEAQLKVP